MKRFKGIGASQGIAIGRLAFFEQLTVAALAAAEPETPANNVENERLRLDEAFAGARKSLETLRQHALKEVGPEQATIVEIQQFLLDDEDMRAQILELVDSGRCTAEYAVQSVGRSAAAQLDAVEDAYLRERKADVIDISNRVLGLLLGLERSVPSDLGGQFVLAAEDLFPSEMIQVDRSNVLAVVCREGSEVSHSAILARMMDIPAVLRLGREQYGMLRQYDTVIVDGFRGELVVEPDERTLAHYRELRATYLENRERLKKLRGLPSRTVDGVEIIISAEVSGLSDLDSAIENDAQEIGLFRYDMFHSDLMATPDEQDQFEIYQQFLLTMGRRRITVCTVDFGKAAAQWMSMQQGEIPDKSYRSISVEMVEISHVAAQFRALLRAAFYGRLAILLPMIVSEKQVEIAHAMLESCRHELTARGVVYGDVEIGILIETPSAALISDKLVWLADFFLIDIDNLTRHVMLTDFLKESTMPHNIRHPAIMRALQMVAAAASRRNIRCGVCGRMGADLEHIQDFLTIGINEFVVAPSEVLPMRQKIREIDLGHRRWIPNT